MKLVVGIAGYIKKAGKQIGLPGELNEDMAMGRELEDLLYPYEFERLYDVAIKKNVDRLLSAHSQHVTDTGPCFIKDTKSGTENKVIIGIVHIKNMNREGDENQPFVFTLTLKRDGRRLAGNSEIRFAAYEPYVSQSNHPFFDPESIFFGHRRTAHNGINVISFATPALV